MKNETLKILSKIIKERIDEKPESSYVSKLVRKGKIKIANKVGEEAVETVSAFLAQEKHELLEESADLIFHLIVLLEYSGSSFEDVLKVLEKRMEND
tara:strand:+ start:458 stop:748 length:291 start_codon:yes stop_codon:yes gene_type:complete